MRPGLLRHNKPGLAVALLGLFALAACGSLIGPSNPPPQIYRLDPDVPLPAGRPPVSWQLAVARPDTMQTLDTNRIALLRGATMDYYADAQWNDSVPRLIQSLLVQAFDKSGIIQAATMDSAGVRTDLTLSTELRDFEAQYDNANAAPLVVVDTQAKLLDQRGQVIASMDSRQTARATENSIASVVQAFDTAMASSLSQIVAWTLQATPH